MVSVFLMHLFRCIFFASSLYIYVCLSVVLIYRDEKTKRPGQHKENTKKQKT